MSDGRDALELIASLLGGPKLDVKSPRGTKPSVTYADVTTALGFIGDSIGSDMVLAIVQQDERSRRKIEAYLEDFVMQEAKGKAAWEKVYPAVVDAVDDVIAGKTRTGRSVSRYYRWAAHEFYDRATNAAISARKILYADAVDSGLCEVRTAGPLK